MNWFDWLRVLDNPRRFRLALLLLVAAIAALFVLAATLRLGQAIGGGPAAAPTPSATPTVVNTRLIPPVTDAPAATSSPTTSWGDPAPILLEGLQAWLDGDARKFAGLATPEVVEAAHDAPAPAGGQEILSQPEVMAPGPTQATYRMKTTSGWMSVTMQVSQSKVPAGWVISDLEYVK